MAGVKAPNYKKIKDTYGGRLSYYVKGKMIDGNIPER